MENVFAAMSHFPGKRFQPRHSKICEKLKNTLFKRSEDSFFSSRELQNHFLKSFLWPNFDLNTLNALLHFPRKWFQLRHSKNCKKLKNTAFQTLRRFAFEFKAQAPNHFLRSFLWPNFDLHSFWCFVSLSQFRYSKNCKKLKNTLFKR